MGLKIEDLENEFNRRNLFELDSEHGSRVSQIEVSPSDLIQRSMKDALQAMVDTQETARSQVNK